MSQHEDPNSESNVIAPDGAGAPYISKSKFLWGVQCPKLLWHAYNAKDKIPPPDAQAQAIFYQGHEVGSLAKKLFPDGIEVGQGVTDLDETIRLTRMSAAGRNWGKTAGLKLYLLPWRFIRTIHLKSLLPSSFPSSSLSPMALKSFSLAK